MVGPRGLRLALVVLALVNMLPAIEIEDSWLLLAIVSAAGLLGLSAWRPDGVRRIPAYVVYAGVVASIFYLLHEMAEPGTVYVLDLAHFMILLCACKFLELRTDRDVGLTGIIAGLVLVIGAFASGSILFAIAVVCDISVGVWWLLAFQMQRELAAAARRRAAAREGIHRDHAPPPVHSATALYRPAVVIGGGMCTAAAMLFVSVPRGWGHSMLGTIQRVMPTMTGFTEDVELTGAPLTESDTPVMRVRYTQNGKPIGGEDFRPYMRGITLEQYYGTRWRRTAPTSLKSVRAGLKSSPEPLAEARAYFRPEEIIQQEVWLDRLENNYLFAMYPPLGFGSESIIMVRRNPRDESIQARDVGHGVINYVVETPVRVTPRVVKLLNPLKSDQRPPRGPQSAIPATISKLAADLAKPIGDHTKPENHERIVMAMRNYLAGPAFTYSLDPGGSFGDQSNPIEQFLFVTHKGHCEYFASALCLMCQALDIPARFASGYYAGEYNPVGGFYQFRQRDAHAWVEVFYPGSGWQVVDPSPATAERRRRPDLTLMSELHRLAGYLQFEWSTFVVAFDSDHRQELVERFMKWLEELGSDRRGAAMYWAMFKSFLWGPSFLYGWRRGLYWLFLILVSTMAVVSLRIAWIVGLLVREFLPRRGRGASAAPRVGEARFYDRVLVLLAHKGHEKRSEETPREFAARLAGDNRDLRDLADITEWFYGAQYGGQHLEAPAKERVRAFLQRLREEPAFGMPSRA